MRILVVEDEAVVAMSLEAMVEDFGYAVAGVAGGVERALALVQDAACDGAILDANLNGRWSTPVAAALRARGVPFVVVSGYSPEQLAELGFTEAAVSKPCRPRDLEAALARFAV